MYTGYTTFYQAQKLNLSHLFNMFCTICIYIPNYGLGSCTGMASYINGLFP